MFVWKESAASIILVLSMFNSVVRGLAGFARIFEGAADEAELEATIISRANIKDLCAKHKITDADIKAMREERLKKAAA